MVPSKAMTKAAASRLRAPAAVAILALSVLAGGAGSCADTRFSLGEGCLKDEDCLSGICAQQHCVAAPPAGDGSAAITAVDAEEESEGPPADSAPGSDSPADGPADQQAGDAAQDAVVTDVFAEVAVDAPADGRADAATGPIADSSTDGEGGG